MSAELLCRAAAKLRECASATTPGNWKIYADTEGRGSDLEYIALMHPPVALALADWLDAEAKLYCPNLAAFGLARAVLRDNPEAVNTP